jgi:hypothetical protein
MATIRWTCLPARARGARKEIFYFDAGGNLNAVRYMNWKIHFCLMEGDITQAYRKTPSWPIVVNLRQNPYERFAFESRMYLRWMAASKPSPAGRCVIPLHSPFHVPTQLAQTPRAHGCLDGIGQDPCSDTECGAIEVRVGKGDRAGGRGGYNA